jgi:hypothetical protein
LVVEIELLKINHFRRRRHLTGILSVVTNLPMLISCLPFPTHEHETHHLRQRPLAECAETLRDELPLDTEARQRVPLSPANLLHRVRQLMAPQLRASSIDLVVEPIALREAGTIFFLANASHGQRH